MGKPNEVSDFVRPKSDCELDDCEMEDQPKVQDEGAKDTKHVGQD